jgi:DNA-binding GntR family transcriptional regulator
MRASDKAYSALRDDILHGEFLPGAVFAEVEQASRLNLSRTPIREAFARLAAEGLLVALSGRGYVVSELSRQTIIELFELRQVLEVQIASLVAERRDSTPFLVLREEFSLAIETLQESGTHASYYALVGRLDAAMDDAVQSRFLLAAIRQLRPHLIRARRLARDNPERLLASAREHLMIVDGIVDGDADLAASATSIHLKRSLKHILAAVDLAARRPVSTPEITQTSTPERIAG